MKNELEYVATRAVVGETLRCVYTGKSKDNCLELGELYTVASVYGLMIKLDGVSMIVYPNQMRRILDKVRKL